MVWINDDGLAVKFGIEEAVFRNIGAYSQVDPIHFVEILVDWSELPTVAQNSVILNDNFKLPRGALIERVIIRTPTEAFVGSGSTFNIGIIDTDRASNADVDYFVQEATTAEMNAGGAFQGAGFQTDPGWGGGGAITSPRPVLTAPKLLTWEQNILAFSAGKTVVRIEWSVEPKNADDTLVWVKP